MKEFMPELHPTNERGMPRVESLERAKEIFAKWEPLAKKFGMAQQIVNEMTKQYPELLNGLQAAPENAYEQHRNDQEQLATMFGSIANAFKPGESRMTPGSEPAPVLPPAKVVASPTVPIAPVPVTQPPTVTIGPQSIDTGSVAVPGTKPGQAPDTAEEQLQARVKEIVEKIKHHPFDMKPEDWEFRRAHHDLVNQALNDSASPVPMNEAAIVPEPKPTLDQSRTNFAEAMAKNSKVFDDYVMNPALKDELLGLQKTYDEQHLENYQKIYGEQGPKAAMQFALDEERKRIKAALESQPQINRERIAKIAGKLAGSAIGMGLLAGIGIAELAGRIKKKIENVNWSKAYDNLKKRFSEPSKPATISEKLKSWATGKPLEKDAKKAEDDAKAAQKALEESTKAKEKGSPKEAVELAPGVEFKKARYIERLMGEPLEGGTRSKWNKFKKDMPLKFFIYPEDPGATWSPENKKKIAAKEIDPLELYPAYARMLHKDLRRYVETKKIPVDELSKLKDIDTLLGKAIAEGFIE